MNEIFMALLVLCIVGGTFGFSWLTWKAEERRKKNDREGH
jgi:hypothetical protein